ncbi:MAG: hypothetical protein U0556_07490 [Dehalococcoidia bacterium]
MSRTGVLLSIQLAARDPERSRAFYGALGYAPLASAPNTLALAQRPDCRLIVTPASFGDPASDFLSRGVLALGFYTNNLDEATGVLEAAGATPWSGPVDYQLGATPVRQSMLLGPDGERIGVMEIDSPAFATWRGETLFSEPGLCLIGAPPEALDFYVQTLGWRVVSDAPIDSAPMRTLIRLPDDVAVRGVLLDTGGPSQPRIELVIADLPLPEARPLRGFIGLFDGSGTAGLYDPYSGVTYSVRERRAV